MRAENQPRWWGWGWLTGWVRRVGFAARWRRRGWCRIVSDIADLGGCGAYDRCGGDSHTQEGYCQQHRCDGEHFASTWRAACHAQQNYPSLLAFRCPRVVGWATREDIASAGCGVPGWTTLNYRTKSRR